MIRETPASLTRVIVASLGTALVAVLPLVILAVTRSDAVAASLTTPGFVRVGAPATLVVVIAAVSALWVIVSALRRPHPARP